MCNNIMLIEMIANANGAGRSGTTLVTIEDKLLFILYYVKVYPYKKFSPLNLAWCKVQQMNEIPDMTDGVQQAAYWTMEGIYLNVIPSSSKPFSRLEAESIYGIDGTENGHANVLVIQEKAKTLLQWQKKSTRSRISLLAESIRAKSII